MCPFQTSLQFSWNFNILLSLVSYFFALLFLGSVSHSGLQSLLDASKCNWIPGPREPGIAAMISLLPRAQTLALLKTR